MENKTKAELLEELAELQQRISFLVEPGSAPDHPGPESRLLAESNLAGFVLTESNLIVDISEDMAALVGYQPAELIGKPVLSLVAPEHRDIAEESASKPLSGLTEAYVLRKDGGRILIQTIARDIDFNGRSLRVIAIQDISEEKRLLQALVKSEERFSVAFHTSPDSININRLSDGLYIEINEGFTQITGYTPEDVVGRTSLDLVIWDNPADRERLVQGLREQGQVMNLEAVFRMKDGGKRIGLMSARIIELDDEPHILSVTRDISARKQDEEKIESLNQELLAAYDQTLTGWSRALNLRDPNTDKHSQRVVDLTLQLARAVGVPEDELVHIRRGVLLHDIGKMGISDSILLKPGPLNEEEWAEMRKHPVYAREMLSTIPFLEKALDIPYCHHEKWDGSGYPRGIKGEEIPLAARVFSIIDNYDALLSDRTYRPAWTEENTLAYIRQQAGLAFDPDLTTAFLEMVG